ncbi:hypothetical protein C8R48DRAFT_610934 [Suillus tomentosus]|nr:hypothetical protein C8R48DRAFT_614887 [Suillus tomentosus]KAG1853224.1 hypothetical protein C8R48DRAFT_610934 [Suillus tomentosus]
MTRGPNRASFMWGSSTHNSRIERSWVEVGTQFARMWPEWNAHPISGEGHDQSPNDMRLMGQLEHGLYADDCEGIHPDIIRQYYGTAGKPMHRAPHQTGAGHPSDEEWEDIDDFEDPGVETEDLQELPQLIAADHDSHFHHKPVRVPKHASPFNSATLHNTFYQAFTQVREAGHIPEGFGVLPHEWDGDEYPSHEIIRSGRQGTKELRIPLPDFIWRPRAIKWCQALDVMFRLLELANTDVGSSSDTDSNTDSVGHHNGSDS